MANEKDFIGRKIGKYKITKILTKGGMNSIIYEGEAVEYNSDNYLENKSKFAAIKIIFKSEEIDQEMWDRLYDEILTLTITSNKKNVVKFYEAIHNDEFVAIVMELINGSSLEKKINDYGHFNLKEAIYLFREILIGVRELHNHQFQIIHRDLKPSNILLLKNQTGIRIIDFGISSVVDKTIPSEEPEVVTNESSVFGTLTYVSPDIMYCRGVSPKDLHKKITKQFDFHSLGVIFHEMITGEKPFTYDNEDDPSCLKYYIDFDFLPLKLSLPKIPNAVENIIFKLTASKNKHLKYRYNSVEEVILDLNRAEKIFEGEIKDDSLINLLENRVYNVRQKFIIKNDKKLAKKKKLYFAVSASFATISLILIFFVIIWKIVANG